MKHLKSFKNPINKDIIQNIKDILQELEDEEGFIIQVRYYASNYSVKIAYYGYVHDWFDKIKDYVLQLIDYMNSENYSNYNITDVTALNRFNYSNISIYERNIKSSFSKYFLITF